MRLGLSPVEGVAWHKLVNDPLLICLLHREVPAPVRGSSVVNGCIIECQVVLNSDKEVAGALLLWVAHVVSEGETQLRPVACRVSQAHKAFLFELVKCKRVVCD